VLLSGTQTYWVGAGFLEKYTLDNNMMRWAFNEHRHQISLDRFIYNLHICNLIILSFDFKPSPPILKLERYEPHSLCVKNKQLYKEKPPLDSNRNLILFNCGIYYCSNILVHIKMENLHTRQQFKEWIQVLITIHVYLTTVHEFFCNYSTSRCKY
jgi:hypothetical protein